MSQQLEKIDTELITKLVLDGDVSKMTPEQKVHTTVNLCKALGLNPFSQPFKILKLQGKEVLYATKDCTEQLRKIHGVGITDLNAVELRDIYVVTAKAIDKEGKVDAATGAVNVKGKQGDDLANAIMKAETKAKRRVTLSICGLGMLDESELDTVKVVDPVIPEEQHAEVVIEKTDDEQNRLYEKFIAEVKEFKTATELKVSWQGLRDRAKSEGLSKERVASLYEFVKKFGTELKEKNTQNQPA